MAAAFSERYAMSVHDRMFVGGLPLSKREIAERTVSPTSDAIKMRESIRKNRQVIFALKAHSHTGGDVAGGIIGASKLAIVVSVHGNAVVKYDRSTRSD